MGVDLAAAYIDAALSGGNNFPGQDAHGSGQLCWKFEHVPPLAPRRQAGTGRVADVEQRAEGRKTSRR